MLTKTEKTENQENKKNKEQQLITSDKNQSLSFGSILLLKNLKIILEKLDSHFQLQFCTKS